MDAARRQMLNDSLQRELDRQGTAHGRVTWLLDQLENYVERWRGIPGGGDPASDDLFGMIEIAAALSDAEVKTAPTPALTERWRRFLEVLAETRAGRAIEPQRLAEALTAVRDAVSSRTG